MSNVLLWHNAEEAAVAAACLFTAGLIYRRFRRERDNLFFMKAEGFLILSLSSLIHLLAHLLGEVQGLLYGSLSGYSIGFLSVIAAPFLAERGGIKRYIPSLLFFSTNLLILSNTFVVDFFRTRFSLWMPVAFLSALLTMIYLSDYLRSRKPSNGVLTAGYFLCALSSVFLFFPSDIGSHAWTLGHILRPVGFCVLLAGYSMSVEMRNNLFTRLFITASSLAVLPVMLFTIISVYFQERGVGPLDMKLFFMGAVLILLMCAFVIAYIFALKTERPLRELIAAAERFSRGEFEYRIPENDVEDFRKVKEAFNEMGSAMGLLTADLEDAKNYFKQL
ncbi:MAG TPA: HAMP domain-containing protein, partial [Dissulfurispiraceae bacterium]